MRTWQKELTIFTRKQRDVVDVTNEVLSAVSESGIKDGLLVAQLPHATAALVLNEDEDGVKQDLLDKLEDLVPLRGKYRHDRIDDNSHAHLKSAIIGSSRVLPVINGRVQSGKWQSFLVVEEDGPRNRRLVVLVMGE